MKAQEAPSKPLEQPNQTGQAKPSSSGRYYQRVVDSRKRPIRGLYQRYGSYFARIKTKDAQTEKPKMAWFRLEGVSGLDEAKLALAKLQVKQAEGALVAPAQAPKFNEYAAQYLDYYRKVPDAKTPKTMASEKAHVGLLIAHFGETRLNRISKPQIRDFIVKRQSHGIGPRTINLNLITFRNVLKRGLEDGYLQHLPMEGMKPLKFSTPKKPLVSHSDIEKICSAALEVSKNGLEFSHYVKFLAYTGCRRDEALGVRWEDVNFTTKQVCIGATGNTKNRQSRFVDFNVKLEALLTEMRAHRPPDSIWLFPSPQRGTKDIASRTFRETLTLARTQAGLPAFNFHDARHFFASFCVMSGVDYMTTARWLGHKDGGILIGKTYGHLAPGHAQAMAAQLRFEPVILDNAQTA